MNLKEVGHTIQIAGVIYNSDKDKQTYFIMLPDEKIYSKEIPKYFDTDAWRNFFWQTDILETELNDEAKTIVRKAQRQIDGNISWKIYARDNYTCRYCGKTGIPLTVDHIVLWEDGGPSIEENLVTSCKKCNRIRGNMPYEEWIKSGTYIRLSNGLPFDTLLNNLNLTDTLDKIPTSFTKMRGKKR